jgi:hypothetical protein
MDGLMNTDGRKFVGFEVLTAMVVKCLIFWDLRAVFFMLASWRAYSSTPMIKATVSSKRRLTFNRIYGIVSQNIELFSQKICIRLSILRLCLLNALEYSG